MNGAAEELDEIEFTLSRGEYGKQVRAKPAEGWYLAGWKISNKNYVMQDDYRKDGNVTQPVTITAVYEPLEKPVNEIPPTGPSNGSSSGGGGAGGGAGTGISRPAAGIVIDGNNHYKDTYEDDLNHAMGNVSGNESITQDEADIIGDFFDTIAP